MADDWQAGDLALCVSRHRLYPRAVKAGATFTVSSVIGGQFNIDDEFIGVGLHFDDAPAMHDGGSYDARRFIKITPPAADEFDLETIELLNRTPENATVSERIDL